MPVVTRSTISRARPMNSRSNLQNMLPMQTRSMTAQNGTPHDLDSFSSYVNDDFDSHLPFKKRQRFLDWDEEAKDNTIIDAKKKFAANVAKDVDFFLKK